MKCIIIIIYRLNWDISKFPWHTMFIVKENEFCKLFKHVYIRLIWIETTPTKMSPKKLCLKFDWQSTHVHFLVNWLNCYLGQTSPFHQHSQKNGYFIVFRLFFLHHFNFSHIRVYIMTETYMLWMHLFSMNLERKEMKRQSHLSSTILTVTFVPSVSESSWKFD